MDKWRIEKVRMAIGGEYPGEWNEWHLFKAGTERKVAVFQDEKLAKEVLEKLKEKP